MTVGLTGQSFTASQGTAFAPNETVQYLLDYHNFLVKEQLQQGISSQEATLTGQSVTSSL